MCPLLDTESTLIKEPTVEQLQLYRKKSRQTDDPIRKDYENSVGKKKTGNTSAFSWKKF